MLVQHLGIIPDGNRRWARMRGLPLDVAYEAGYSKLKEVTRWALDYDVKYLTVYAMSRENCTRRDEVERRVLLRILEKAIRDIEEEKLLEEYEASLMVSGDLSLLPNHLRYRIEDLVERYRDGRRVLHIGLCYNVWWELLNSNGSRMASKLLPPIDLVIRTGGMWRISGFFPLLVEYSELYFTDTLWPDFTRREFEYALEWFRIQKRNFGR